MEIHGFNQLCRRADTLSSPRPKELSDVSSRPCMELLGGNGEPDIRERPFEELPGLEGFNEYYKRNGGFGGGINNLPIPLHRSESIDEDLEREMNEGS